MGRVVSGSCGVDDPQQVSLAWNGSVAGLLACGFSSSGYTTRTIFQPLDARGAPAGD